MSVLRSRSTKGRPALANLGWVGFVKTFPSAMPTPVTSNAGGPVPSHTLLLTRLGRYLGFTVALAGSFLLDTAPLYGQRVDRGTGDDPAIIDLFPMLRERQKALSRRVPNFFPPNPPPLDRPVAHLVTPPGQYPAPPELAAHVNEIFYPALGTRLHTNSVYLDTRAKLDLYRTTKVLLQNELRTTFDRHRESDPAVRRKALEDLARAQTPKIVELEIEAERLRRDLVTRNTSWSAQRRWHLVDKVERGYSPLEIAMVIRGYTFYQRGLSPEQRRLLREIMMEILAAVDEESGPESAVPDQIWFSPSPARIRLPDELPPELAAKVASYLSRKSALKKELYDRVYSYDGAVLGVFRWSLKALAEKQAPEFAAIEALSEEIRRGLADMPQPPPPDNLSPLPPMMAHRVANVLRDRALAERDATIKADAIISRRYDNEVRVRAGYRFDEAGMRVSVEGQRNARGIVPPNEEEIVAKVQAELAAVADDYGNRLVELLNEQENIRREAAELLGDTRRERVDAALYTTSRIAIRRESEDAYRDYRIAVLEPGLSSEQRRMLFDRAVERLNLPLPRGEIQVAARFARW